MGQPFLKWAGGKRQLLPVIEENLPSTIDEIETYVEPFIGGGAVFFSLIGKYNFKKIYISDINQELTLCYTCIQSSVDVVISELLKLIDEYPNSREERKDYFYELREKWNKSVDKIDSMNEVQRCERVAQTLFLNKTCFNGLFRVNKSGKFNVPTGNYKKPSFTTKEVLKEASKCLSKVEINTCSYKDCLKYVDENTFVYFDPPYRPLTNSSSFTSYSKSGFNDTHQQELADFCRELNDKGAKLLLSNSDPKNIDSEDDFFDEMYSGFIINRILANRAINSVGTGRGKITELLIRNY